MHSLYVYIQFQQCTLYLFNKIAINFDINNKVRTNTFKRISYKFTGWNTRSDGTGDGYTENGKLIHVCDAIGRTVEYDLAEIDCEYIELK